MKKAMHGLNKNKGEREVFVNLKFSTEARFGGLETGVYVGEVEEIALLENTIGAIETEIERLKAQVNGSGSL